MLRRTKDLIGTARVEKHTIWLNRSTQVSTRALIYPELETDMMVENADIE
jgi:hypothetical protein